MVRRRPPGTEEGWYVLHDLRRIDWNAWRDAPERERERAIEEGVEYLRAHADLADADEGASAVFSVVGHKADLMILHLRPTMEHLDRAERRFESTAMASFTERATSYVSVTEVSGYMHEDLTDGLEEMEDAGMRNYMQQRIYPTIPDADHVCFYPMDKRRDPEHNWYDLPFEERADYMSAHGDVGREYAGRVTQIITGSVGLDDHEWGVTLFANDPTDIKDLLYEMRFDPSTSKFAEFGSFYVGRQFPPEDLGALLAGEAVPTDEPLEGDTLESGTVAGDHGSHASTDAGRASNVGARGSGSSGGGSTGGSSGGGSSSGSSGGGRTGGSSGGGSSSGSSGTGGGGSGGRPSGDAAHDEIDAADFTALADGYGVDVGDAGYGLVFESEADAAALEAEVDDLASNFDHYDTHAGTTVQTDDGTAAVVSLWANERAANTASGFLSDLPGVDGGVGAALGGAGDGADGADGDTAGESSDESAGDSDADPDSDTDDGGSGGRPDADPKHEEIDPDTFQRRVHRFGVSLEDHPAAGYALLFRSDADAEDLVDEVDGLRSNFEHYDTHVLTTVRADSGDTAVVSLWANERAANTASGFLSDLTGAGPGVGTSLGAGDDAEPRGTDEDDDVRGELAEHDVYAGQPHGEDVYAMVLYSEADPGELESELDDLAEQFEHYDSHVKSAVYVDEHAPRDDAESGSGTRSAIVSIWETKDAADEAGGFLADLPGIVARADESSNFGTMGMFYTVQPNHREDFVGTFEEVGEALADMDGHLDSRLLVNTADENDMFIASQWREKDDAMAFFRSDAFRETVQFGREILADRPRHVFLA